MNAANPPGASALARLGPRLLILAVSFALTIALCEVLLRAVDFRYTPMRIELKGNNDWRTFHAFRDADFTYDPYLLWRPRPGVDVFNSSGYRGKEITTSDPPRRFRVLTLGDSNTLGWRGPDGPNWPADLEELLRQVDSRYTVLNVGVWGYSSFQGARRLRQSLALDPAVVFICFGANDALQVQIADADYAARMYAGSLVGSTRLGQFLVSLWDLARLRKPARTVARVSAAEFEVHLRGMVALARSHNIQAVLITRPFTGDARVGSWKIAGRVYNATTLRVARSEHIPAVDMYDYFAGRDQYFADESHFTEEGHRLAARLVYDTVRRVLPR